MKARYSCREAMEQCIKEHYFSIAHLYKEEKVMSMHLHDCYELYYSISGGKQFLIDQSCYPIAPGDVFTIDRNEMHYLNQVDTDIHERIVLFICPDYLARVSDNQTDLSACFKAHTKQHKPMCHLSRDQQNRFLFLVNQILSVPEYGKKLLEQAYFTELMVLLNQCSQNQEKTSQASSVLPLKEGRIDEILHYINENIQQELSIEQLSTYFFLSPSYICRLFKQITGVTINQYITGRRISIAKSLLADGESATDVCRKCGYNDYSSFVKAFHKTIGMSPRDYAKNFR